MSARRDSTLSRREFAGHSQEDDCLLVCVPLPRLFRRSHRVGDAVFCAWKRPRPVVLACKLRSLDVTAEPFQRFRDAAVQASLTARAELVVDRMPDERVRELVALAVQRNEHPRPQRLVDAVEQSVFLDAGQRRERVEPKRPGEGRGEREHTRCLRRQSREALADRLADTLGDRDLARRGFGDRQLQRNLADEERIASGLTCHRLGEFPRYGAVCDRLRAEPGPRPHRGRRAGRAGSAPVGRGLPASGRVDE